MNDDISTTQTTPFLSDKAYNTLKYATVVILPALGALYFALSQIWGFPNGEKVVGTIASLETFIGAVLMLSKSSYDSSDAKYDGAIEIAEETPEKKTMALNLFSDPYSLDQKKQVVFRVDPRQ